MIGIHRLMKPWYVWRPWQLARRAPRGEWMASARGDSALPVAWGVSLRADPRMTIGRSIQTTGIYDPAVTEVLARLIRAGDTVRRCWRPYRLHGHPCRRLLRRRRDTCWRGSRIQTSSTCSSGTWQRPATRCRMAEITLRNAALGKRVRKRRARRFPTLPRAMTARPIWRTPEARRVDPCP